MSRREELLRKRCQNKQQSLFVDCPSLKMWMCMLILPPISISKMFRYNTWTMVIITIGTEEICQNCSIPDTDALMNTIDILNRGIHKAFVIMLGPIHVSSRFVLLIVHVYLIASQFSYHQKANLLRTRCECFKDKEESFITSLSERWSKAFEEVQEHADRYKRQHFGVNRLYRILSLHLASIYSHAYNNFSLPILLVYSEQAAAKSTRSQLCNEVVVEQIDRRPEI